ncbi:glycosyltransferase [Romboutsia sp. CE17]|uniref:glycosyltransferase n=1 Tax=Romboutsia sp. CE17 TaxID=2724150 RepID=UPI001442B656|nr:glycosyltransferase [Romboutsia sp. CE17]QJA08186.1 glycosyltransferase [Romboutsia sp. CE17]
MKEVFPKSKSDRRLLTHVPDPTNRRKTVDRRGINLDSSYEFGIRYELEIPVYIYTKEEMIEAQSIDLSVTGILIKIKKDTNYSISEGDNVKLKFYIPEGYMKEGYDHKVKINSNIVRSFEDEEYIYFGCVFEKNLHNYFTKRRWISEISIASIFLGLVSFSIIGMRINSVIYFRYDPLIYGYSILTAVYLLSRYLFGAFYKSVPIDENYTPGVSVIIPCFNEEEWIQKTIIGCLNQDYPIDKLEVIVVDDCSNDNSVQKINEIIERLKVECSDYDVESRIKFILQPDNRGKREALVAGVNVAKHELVTFVDSDSFLEPRAIKNLVQPFRDPKVGGVTGRTDVENAWTNYITKMQAVRYYVAFRMIKAAESIFDCVTCLSGPISCYRKDLVDKYKYDWLSQTFLGQPATFGDDRSMTNFILKHHRTVYQDSAICTTIVPSDFKVFLKQQMRWKRSWLRESIRAGGFMWKKEPFHAISFYAGIIVPVLAPLIVIYNMMYVPIVYKTFPIVFISGILLMSFLMSFVYLLFRKSKIWIYGLWFCLFYECILIWQMPIACLTFWKSTWGTRKTKEDIEHEKKQKKRKQDKIRRKNMKEEYAHSK